MGFIFRRPASDLSDACVSFTETQKANKVAEHMKEYPSVVRIERERERKTKAILKYTFRQST